MTPTEMLSITREHYWRGKHIEIKNRYIHNYCVAFDKEMDGLEFLNCCDIIADNIKTCHIFADRVTIYVPGDIFAEIVFQYTNNYEPCYILEMKNN